MSTPAAVLLGSLREGRYADLETSLGALQRQFERGEVGETELERNLRAFQQPDPALGERFGKWMEAHQGSYVAHAALAGWLLSRAWALRGGSTMNRVSDQGRRGMHHFLGQAEACARHATTLTDNPLSAWLAVAAAHNTLGCDLELADVQAGRSPDWFTRPLVDNPHSLLLRRALLRHLRSEWGGSEEMMLAFVRQQQEGGGLSPGDLQRLWAQYHAQVAHHEWMFARRPDRALEHARLAADLDGRYAELLFGFVSDQGATSTTRREALERYLMAAEREVETGQPSLWYARGALLRNVDLLAPYSSRVARLLSRMADAGEHDAAWLLGALAHDAPHLAWPDPTPVLMRARDEGHVESAEMLVWLVQKTRPQDQDHIREHTLKAADLGSSDMSWAVYADFAAFQKQFGLDSRARYRYLLRAADAGNNDARFALAEQLRAGRVEVGEDGVLRPVDTPPLQDSLDYARHLLERAAAEDHREAEQALKRAGARDWNAGTARRIKPTSVKAPKAAATPAPREEGFRFPWFLALFLFIGLFRACSSLNDSPGAPAAGPFGPPASVEAFGRGVAEGEDLDQTLRRLGLDSLPKTTEPAAP